jgi:predicted PurR-regulated permease PerM
MVLWGLFAVSSADHFLKPILISRGASQSLLLVALGVVGGALAFGFIGIFLGPALLALVQMFIQTWTKEHPDSATA